MPTAEPRFDSLLRHPVVRALARAAAPAPCHLVGGALRDRLLGRHGYDLDAVVAGSGEGVARRLAAELPARLVRLGGDRFAAFRLVGSAFTLDLWDRGSASLDADLARRDFTVNAFAVDAGSGRLADPFDGVGDCRRRRLRATTPRVLAEDPLRVVRLVRFAATLDGFRPDAETVALAQAAAPGLVAVAAERVREEMAKVLAAPDFAAGFELMAGLNLYPGLLLARPGEPAADGGAGGAVARLEELLAEGDTAPPTDRVVARLAVLFRSAGGADASALLAAYRRAGYLAAGPATVCHRLLALERLPSGEPAERRFLHRWGELWTTATVYLGAAGEPPPAAADWRRLVTRLTTLAAVHGQELFAPRPLLDGHQIQRLTGLAPSPRLGRLARRLLVAQVEGRVRDRREAEALLKRLSSGAD